MSQHTHCGSGVCFIIPPHIVTQIVERSTGERRARALESLAIAGHIRGQRAVHAQLALAVPAGEKRRTIYDAKGAQKLPGKLVRGEGDSRSQDVAVNEAYDASGAVYDFYSKVYQRNSVDDKGLRLDSTVHYGRKYDNAFWNGQQMVYGDGDGQLFQRFTISIDVIGHELTHGVTQYEAGLEYQDQPGALNESMSDVFGSLVKQWVRKQTAKQADWIIGEGLLGPKVKGKGLRSMSAPGTAYNDPVLGKDPQPAHMRDYYKGTSDNGGVHINSGIPNRAFYLAAIAIGGKAWERAGRIWYVALRDRLRPTSEFADARAATIAAATDLYGKTSKEAKAVASAWTTVGVS
ncbi:MAG: M4 family metallopeptidase [Alphaproteobacteria bacterium]